MEWQPEAYQSPLASAPMHNRSLEQTSDQTSLPAKRIHVFVSLYGQMNGQMVKSILDRTPFARFARCLCSIPVHANRGFSGGDEKELGGLRLCETT